MVLADPTQIHQIVMNLFTNAYHAMKASGGMIKITLNDIQISEKAGDRFHEKIPPGRFVRLTVSDTGNRYG